MLRCFSADVEQQWVVTTPSVVIVCGLYRVKHSVYSHSDVSSLNNVCDQCFICPDCRLYIRAEHVALLKQSGNDVVVLMGYEKRVATASPRNFQRQNDARTCDFKGAHNALITHPSFFLVDLQDSTSEVILSLPASRLP